MNPLKEEMQQRWNIHADSYESATAHGICSPEEIRRWTELLQSMAGETLLDVGCGTGFVTLLAARVGLKVTAVDWSQGMMGIAREKSAKEGLFINFVLAETENLPFPDNTFRVLTARHVIWTLTEPVEAFRQWHRVLATGGQVLADYSPREEEPSEAQHYRLEVEKQLPLNRKVNSDTVATIFRQAGFHDVQVRDISGPHGPRYLFICTK